MPILEEFAPKMCKLRRVPPSLAFHAKALKKLCICDVKHLRSLENFASVVHLGVFRNIELERIINLPKVKNLVIVECPKMKVLEYMPALQRLNLEEYDVETVPRYLQDVNPRHLLLDCSLSLLTCIAVGTSGPEWDKLSHIQQVKAYAEDKSCPRKWYVVYTRDPFHFETNISRSAIAQGKHLQHCLVRFVLRDSVLLGPYCFLWLRPIDPICHVQHPQHPSISSFMLAVRRLPSKRSGP
jgi:hypothetical protein